jgi:hypothetical protein
VTFNPGAGGGFARPPLENAASSVLAAARGRMGPRHAYPTAPPPQKLTPEQQAEALDIISKGAGCRCCAGIHPGDEMACPRLASFELDGDGNVRAGSYFPDGQWDRSSVVFATDAAEEGSTDGG